MSAGELLDLADRVRAVLDEAADEGAFEKREVAWVADQIERLAGERAVRELRAMSDGTKEAA